MDYTYTCKGKTIKLKETDDSKVVHGKYFVVKCNRCCNITVLHLLREESKDA